MRSTELSRRDFLRFSIAAASGAALSGCGSAEVAQPLAVDLWVELLPDGRVRMLTKRVEMGQGAHTGLRTLLAEELDVIPEVIEIVQVTSDPGYGEIITGGSYTIAGSNLAVRVAGATARQLLLQAAAARWHVPVGELTTHESQIHHQDSHRMGSYAEFVPSAAKLPKLAKEQVSLKNAAEWKYIGRPRRAAHHDAIVTGAAEYGLDVKVPGLVFASLVRAPQLNSRITRFDASKAAAVRGFVSAIALDGNKWPCRDHVRQSIAVIATNSWAAIKARELLTVEWRSALHDHLDSSAISRILEEHAGRPGFPCLRNTVGPKLSSGGETFQAKFNQAYVAHAPMEPPNATAWFNGERLEVWCGTQRQTRLKEAIVSATKLSPDRVVVHSTLLGGSFGRRLEIDYGLEAAVIAVQLKRPVQVLWSREDDIRMGLYKPGSVHHLSATLARDGRIVSLTHRFVAESVLKQQEPASLPDDGSDWTLATPLAGFFYEVPRLSFDYHAVQPMVPCAWWRGTYWNNVTVAVETFIDELSQASGQDPLQFRLRHLVQDVRRELIIDANSKLSFHAHRMRGVLVAATQNAGWDTPARVNTARGLACGIYDSPECHVAVVVEMAIDGAQVRMLRATVALDVGIVVNPEIVKAQAVGGFLMGASLALNERISFRAGQVEQTGFADYPLLRMADVPPVEVVIVAGHSEMCGVGEIVTPASAAAVVNALSRLKSRRIRSLPALSTN